MRHMIWTVIIKDLNSKVYSRNYYSLPDNGSAFVELQGKLEANESIVAIVKGNHEVYSNSDFRSDNNML